MRIESALPTLRVFVAMGMLLGTASCVGSSWNPMNAANTRVEGAKADASRVGTWSCAPQRVEPGNLPPAPGLGGRILRQIVHVSIGGRRPRVRLSNLFGDSALTMTSVRVGRSLGGSGIDPASDAALSFAGRDSITLPAGATAWSDPIDFALVPLSDVAVTIRFTDVPAAITGHPGSRTTSYIQASGDITPDALSVDHWYFLTDIDVDAVSSSSAVVTLGDSITDGRGSTTNGNDRWPDNLARRLQANRGTADVAVLNQGIGGNAVLTGGLGPTALERFERDVINRSRVQWVIVLEGVNDIGASRDSAVASRLIAAYRHFVAVARDHAIRIYGVPILPFGGSAYDSVEHETARQAVNQWIRGDGAFDAVIDLDAAVRDPANPTHLLSSYDSGDHLHLSVAGYHAMADAIDLRLFAR